MPRKRQEFALVQVSPTLQFEIVLFSDIPTAPPSVELMQIEEGGR